MYLKNDLDAELDVIEENLTFYKTIREKIYARKMGILAAIEEAVAGTKNYNYRGHNVTHKEYAQNETIPDFIVDDKTFTPNPGNKISVEITAGGNILNSFTYRL